jgi:hypothetical protein
MEKYRKISHWALGVIAIVMFLFIIGAILSKNDFVDGEFIFISAFYFVPVAFVVVFLLLASCLLKEYSCKEERKSYLYTSLIFFASILLLAILTFVLLGVFLGGYKG